VATKKKSGPQRGRKHLDRRAGRLLADPVSAGDADEMLTTKQLASWLSCSPQSLEIYRSRGDGPPFTKITTRYIRYRREAVRKWLRQREHLCTKEYKR
jgi:hypothetical protein